MNANHATCNPTRAARVTRRHAAGFLSHRPHFTSPLATARGGFTLIELLIVVAIIAILALIAVPNFLEAQVRAKVSRVRGEMGTLAGALEAYWMDHRAYPPNLIEMVVVSAGGPDQAAEIDAARRMELNATLWLCETQASIAYRLGEEGSALTARDCPLFYNAATLMRVTTPVAYMGRLPIDIFARGWRSRQFGFLYRPPPVWGPPDPTAQPNWDIEFLQPYGYYNFADLHPDGASIPAVGRSVPYVLVARGPDCDADFTDPAVGFPPFYDPTNGTVSDGDILLFGGE